MSATGPFDIAFDPVAKRLRYTMRGFWTLEDVKAFETAIRDTIGRLARDPGRGTISDGREFPLQSREVSEALGDVRARTMAINPGRLAVIVPSVMSKLQVERTLTTGDVRVFTTIEEAEQWLSGPAEQ